MLKIAKILHLFSQGDKVVKTHFAKPSVIERMLRVLPHLSQDVLLLVLKSICNISMDSTTLDLLEEAGAIPALVPFLNSPYAENQHQVLLTMYYLTQIKVSRQEQAARSGVIPHLQRFIREEHPLKQFAFPIILLLAKNSSIKIELKKYGGVWFYLDILKSDTYWRSHILEVIANWLSEDIEKTGNIINSPQNIRKLLRVFKETNNVTQFEKMLPLYRKMLSASFRVNQSFGLCGEFISEIKHRLEKSSVSNAVSSTTAAANMGTNNNNIRINLLKILALLFAGHHNPVKFASEHNLEPLLQKLHEDKNSVIVASLASKLLDKIKQAMSQTQESS